MTAGREIPRPCEIPRCGAGSHTEFPWSGSASHSAAAQSLTRSRRRSIVVWSRRCLPSRRTTSAPSQARTLSGTAPMQKTPRIIIGSVVLSAIGAFAIYRTTSAADRDGAVILASGTVEATQAELGFQLSGRLEHLTVREGDQVAAGTRLASLEQSELIAQRDITRAQVAAAQAGLS